MYVVCAMFGLASCKKPYAPTIVKTAGNYLVVEGVIKAGPDSTIIQLSRTGSISDSVKLIPEKNAVVTVEGDQNVSYPLKELNNGMYGTGPLGLDIAHKYRLRIVRAGGKVYLSDFVAVKTTPPIDSLNYEVTATGLNFFSATHDPSNNTRYYRWDYTETYVYISPITTYYKFDNSKFFNGDKSVFRTPAEYISTCYINRYSSTIIINSSAKLEQDVIVHNPITQVSSTSPKILYRYSILLKQYALTKDAYEFWTILKRNTESLGSVFDAQPSQIPVNVHNVSDPSEPVIGYVSASTLSQKRIFIDRTELPVWPITPSECAPDAIIWYKGGGPPNELKAFILIPLAPVVVGYDKEKKDSVYSVKIGDYRCVDCTYFGTAKKPAFWK